MFAKSTKNQLLKHLLGDSFFYGTVLVVSRLGWFFLLPIYWRFLTPADYGIIGIAQLIQGFLVPLLSLGLHDAVQRFYPEWSERQRGECFAIVGGVLLIWSSLLCIGFTFAEPIFSHIFQNVPMWPYITLSIWTAFFVNLSTLPLAIFRIRGQAKWFSFVSTGMFLTQSILSVTFVAVFKEGPAGYLFGGLLSAAIWSVFLLLHFWPQIILTKNFSGLKNMLAYSMPVVPTTILDGTVSLFDRFFLDKHVPLARIGFYNVAQQFGSILNIFNQSLKTAWVPFLFRIVNDRKDAPAITARFSVYYVALLIPPALGTALLSRELIELFGADRFTGAYEFVPWFVLTIYFQSVTAAMGRGLDLAKNNKLWPFISVAQVSVSILALSQLVPEFGAIGAAWSVTLAAGVRALVQISIAHYVFRRPFHGWTLLVIWLVALAGFAIGSEMVQGGLLARSLEKLGLVLIVTLIVAVVVIDSGFIQNIKKYIFSRRV